MPDLFGEQEIDDIARNNPARIEPTLGQSISSAYDASQNSMTIISERYSIWEGITKNAEAAFGSRIPNPMDFTGTGSSRFSEESTLKNLHAQREKLSDPNTFPDYTLESIDSTIRAKRAKAQQRRADISAREGTLGAVLGFGAEAAGIILDPLLLPALLVGAPMSAGIVRAALIEFGIGTVTEIPIQTLIQAGNVSIGEQADIGQAVTNVVTVGVGAGLLTLGLRGLIAGGQKLIARGQADQAVVDAVQGLQQYESALRANPFLDTAHGINQHLARLTEAEAKLHGGKIKADYLNSTAVGSVRGNTRFQTQIEVTPTTSRNNIKIKKRSSEKPNLEVQSIAKDIKSADIRSKELLTSLRETEKGSRVFKALRREKDEINRELKRLRVREKEIKERIKSRLQREAALEAKSGIKSQEFDILDDKRQVVGEIFSVLRKKDKQGRVILEIEDISSSSGLKNTFGTKDIRNVLQQIQDVFPKATHIKGLRISGARRIKAGVDIIQPLPRRKLPLSMAKVISTLPDIGDKVPKFFVEMTRFAERMKVEVAKKEFIPGPSSLREIRTRPDINDLLSGGKVPDAPLNPKGAASVTKAKAEQFDAMATEADAAGRNPVINLTDEVTGKNISKTLKEWQEDIKADELVTRELEKCIALQGISNV